MDDITFTPEDVKKMFEKYAIELILKTAVTTFIFTYIIFSIIHS